VPASSRLEGPLRRPPFERRALARLVDLKAALLAEARARGPDGPRMRVPQLAWCSRDQLASVDGWASIWRCARTDVVEAAGARSSERDFNPRAPLTLSSVKGHRGRVNTRGPSLENDIACVL